MIARMGIEADASDGKPDSRLAHACARASHTDPNRRQKRQRVIPDGGNCGAPINRGENKPVLIQWDSENRTEAKT